MRNFTSKLGMNRHNKFLPLLIFLCSCHAWAGFDNMNFYAGPSYSTWEVSLKNSEKDRSQEERFSLLGAEAGLVNDNGSHRLVGTLQAYIATSGSLRKSDLIDKNHFLEHGFLLLAPSFSYRYAVFPWFLVGGNASVKMPLDPVFILKQLTIGSMIFGASIDSEVVFSNKISAVLRFGAGTQIMSTDHTFISEKFNSVTLLYNFD